METSSHNLKSARSINKQDEGDSARYQQATIRFQLNHQQSQRLKRIDQILDKGNESSILVPRPGEFLVVSSRTAAAKQNQQQSPEAKTETSHFNPTMKALPLFSARKSVTRLQETPIQAQKMLKQSASANVLHSVPSAQPDLTLQQMQKQLLQDSNLQTNLTTNIREIMKPQNANLLTQSTRLLSSKQNRQMPKEAMQILKRVQSNFSGPAQKDHPAQMVSLKPSASVNVLPKAFVPLTQRPNSALLLNDADDQTRQQLSQKFDLKGARFRDLNQHKSHSYRPGALNSQRTFKSSMQNSSIPPIVKLQRELIKEKRTISPFMVNEEKILTPSPSLPQLSTLQTERSNSNLKQLNDKTQNLEQKPVDPSQKQFFPLEAYDPLVGQEDLASLIEIYRDQATGVTLGQSRWQLKDNKTDLRACEVLSYLPQEDLFLIKWRQNGKNKKVARFNLVFDKEDSKSLEWRIKEAEEQRRTGQLMHQYVMLCQDTDVSSKSKQVNTSGQKQTNTQCSDNTKTRISYLVSSFDSYDLNVKQRVFKNPLQVFLRSATERYDIKFFRRWAWVQSGSSTVLVQRICETMQARKLNFTLLSQLFVELDQAYLQVHRQILFDSRLPYSDGRYDQISEVIPIHKFQPLQERLIIEQTTVVIPNRSSQFSHLVQHMSNRLHFAHSNRLKILQLSNHHNLTLPDTDIFLMNYNQPVTIEKLIEVNRRSSFSVIKLFKNQTFDMEYEIQRLVTAAIQENKELNERQKLEMTFNQHEYVNTPIPQSFIDETRELQKVLQMRYEQAQRQNYINSTSRFQQKLENILDNLKDSSDKDLQEQDLDNQDILKLSRDSILETRISKAGIFVLQSRLRFNQGTIKIEPPVEKWLDAFMSILDTFESQSNDLPCFNADETILGPVYADLKTHIFLPQEDTRTVQSQKIRSLLSNIFKVMTALVQASSKFEALLNTDLSEFKRYHKKNDFAVDFYKQLLDKGIETRSCAEQLFFEPTLKVGPFHVDCTKIKELVLKKIVDLDNVMCDCIKRKIANNNTQIEEEVEGVLQIIKHQTTYRDIEHVTETKQYVQNLPDKMLQIRALIKDAMSKMTLLEKYQRSLTKEEMANTWFSISKPLSIFEAQGDCIELLEIFSDRFAVDLNVMRATLADEVKSIESEFETLSRYESLQLYERAVNKCDQIYDRLDSAIATSQVVNRREKIYNQVPTEYIKIHDLKRCFLPLNSLWNYARDYFYKINLWMNGPISELDRDKMPNEITLACRGLLKLTKQDLRQIAGMSINIANELRNLYLEVKPFLPIITSLKNPDLQPRHWEIINKTREGTFIDPDLHQSVQDLLKVKIMELMEDIATVSDIASKERQLEIQLTKMRSEWQSVKFELNQYAGTVTLGGVQPIWDMLDEQIQKTMVIAGSPYVKYLIQDVLFWKQQLVKMQEILEEWSKVQRGWLYLFPIFSSADIQEQLESVYLMFQSVDKMWRVIMQQTQNNPQVVEACNQLKLLENLSQCNTTMDRVQKSLNQYLHEKRLLFPRFFFLSNDDLLQILSQTKDPTRVQDHLNKCFEGIYKLKFSGSGNQIQIDGMYSQLDEFVSFNQPVLPFFKKKREYEVKPVEEWLLEVENQMRGSLRREMQESSVSFATLPLRTAE